MTGKNSLGKTTRITLLVTVCFFVFMYALPAFANTWYYYQVQPGDSLWLIGWKFETTTNVISSANGLTTTQIYPGQGLKIPLSTGFVRNLPQGYKRYTAQSGDTFYLVSKKFQTSIEALMSVNRMTTQSLWVGQVLFVPDNGTSSTTPDAGTQPSGGSTATPGTDTQPPVTNPQIPGTDTQPPVTDPQTPGTDTQPPVTNPQTPGAGTQLPDNNSQTPDNNSQQPDNSTQQPGTTVLPPAGSIDYTQPLPLIGQWGEIPAGVVLYHVVQGDNLWVISQRFVTTIDSIKKTNHLTSDLIQVNQPLFITKNSTQPVLIPYPTGLQKAGYGELFDWEYASWIVDTHKIFTIKDAATGKSFKAKRYGGSNHLDAEPLTAADSALMNEIFGGQWTWNSRPVLIQSGEKVLAASMSGMPHSFDSIADNNFAGHFDLYFLNSKTHYDNKLVPLHQQAVLKAAGHI